MKTVLFYIISSAVFAVIGGLLFTAVRYGLLKKRFINDKKRETALLLFFISLFVIFCQTDIPPQFLQGNFSLFAFHKPDFLCYTYFPKTMLGWLVWKINIRDYGEILVNIAGNIVIFAPIGFLAPMIWEKLGAKTILLGFGISCFVEFIQLFIDRNSDYNDIILNTIGAAAGYGMYLIIRAMKKKKTD